MLNDVNLELKDVENTLEKHFEETEIPEMEPVLVRREKQIRQSGHGLRTKEFDEFSNVPQLQEQRSLCDQYCHEQYSKALGLCASDLFLAS